MLASQKLASKVLAEGEQSEQTKSTPGRAVRASARASRTPKPAAEKKTPKREASKEVSSDRSSAAPAKSESATRATRSKSPSNSDETAEQKEQVPEIKTEKIEEDVSKEKKTERPTRRKTMPPLSKSEKAPAVRAPSTPKLPSRQTQNKFKVRFRKPDRFLTRLFRMITPGPPRSRKSSCCPTKSSSRRPASTCESSILLMLMKRDYKLTHPEFTFVDFSLLLHFLRSEIEKMLSLLNLLILSPSPFI